MTEFCISAHLHDALQRLRNELHVVNIWVDAVCIEQSNDVERSEQVHHMARIFNQAKAIKIWIGENAESTKEFTTDTELF